MSRQDIENLDYLHDAVVDDIIWKNGQNSKIAQMVVTCDIECEYPEWAGKRLVVTFNNVLLQSSLLLGHVAGRDSFDSCSEGVSASVMEHIQVLGGMGVTFPKTMLRIALHSGSELEIACDSVTVEVDSR
jgi:hypothetical protein